MSVLSRKPNEAGLPQDLHFFSFSRIRSVDLKGVERNVPETEQLHPHTCINSCTQIHAKILSNFLSSFPFEFPLGVLL